MTLDFTASAGARLAVAVACCIAAVVLVWAVERRPAAIAPPAGPPATAAAERRVELRADCTGTVRQWSVQVLGRDQPGRGEANSWTGTVTVPAGEDVVVRAIADAPGERALRIRIPGRTDEIRWGSGDVVVAVTP